MGLQPHTRPHLSPVMGAKHLRASASQPHNDQCLAPSGALESHRARLREAFGNTLSDEFVEVLLGKLMEALRPNPVDIHDLTSRHGIDPYLPLADRTTISEKASEIEQLIAV